MRRLLWRHFCWQLLKLVPQMKTNKFFNEKQKDSTNFIAIFFDGKNCMQMQPSRIPTCTGDFYWLLFINDFPLILCKCFKKIQELYYYSKLLLCNTMGGMYINYKNWQSRGYHYEHLSIIWYQNVKNLQMWWNRLQSVGASGNQKW